MRLTDLNPAFIDAGGPGVYQDGSPAPRRRGVGVMFDCPCGSGERRYVPFATPLDGGGSHDPKQLGWTRSGETFEALTLSPSIWFRSGCCCWHGFIRGGEVTSA